MLDLIVSRSVYSSPEFDLQIDNAAAQSLKLDEANALLKKLLVGQGPVVFRGAPKADAADTAKLKAEVQRLLTEPAKPISVEAVGEWPYSNFGKPGQVTKTTHDAALDATFVEFANGTRLAIKPTKFSEQHVSVTVSFGGGLLSVPAAEARKLWRMDHLIEGGTGKLTWTQIQKGKAGKDVSIAASVEPLSFQLSGDGRTSDLKRQMELLAAYYVDPAFRTNDFASQLAQYKASIDADQSDPQAIFDREAGYLETNQSPYWKPVRDASELDTAKPTDLEKVLKPQMTGPADVTIVGDVTIEDAIARVSATFGALPSVPRIRAFSVHSGS
jgi:zinc protease